MTQPRAPYYAGREVADLMKHDGGLMHAVGASNFQVLRANRAFPQYAEDCGNTYNHAPMLTYWRGRFCLEYLSNPVSEHTGAGQSFLAVSADGVHWDKPRTIFPPTLVPAGEYACADGTIVEVADGTWACMHQRMGFYHTRDDRLLVSGFYGHAPHHDICPWRNFGIGRVVREIFEDGTAGEIFFIRYLDYAGWTEDRLPYPYYARCADAGFVAACEELLADRLTTEQWTEEHGPEDTRIGLKIPKEDDEGGVASNSPFESASSFCWYSIDERTIAALWKQGKSGISTDGGRNWSIGYEPTFVTSGAKAWGQKTADGRFAVSYVNSLSSEHRYPLVVVTADDGIRFDDMACVFGELPPRRYDGVYKDFGPQYVRGICEGHKEYPDDALWLCHSVNKEDIFVTRVPLPIRRAQTEHLCERFDEGASTRDWNLYSTKWAPSEPGKDVRGVPCLCLTDRDPCDYARALRVLPASAYITVTLDLAAGGAYAEDLEIELTDARGTPAARVLYGNGRLGVRYGSNIEPAAVIADPLTRHRLAITVDCANNTYAVAFDGRETLKSGGRRLVHKVHEVERLIVRTKPRRYLPNYEIYPETPDLPHTDTPVDERAYFIYAVHTAQAD